MSFSILHRYGDAESPDQISDDMIREMLAELSEDVEEVEHGDVWLADAESGWGLGVFVGARGLVVLENSEPGGAIFHRTGVSEAEAFTLLRRMADGDLEAIRAEVWHPG